MDDLGAAHLARGHLHRSPPESVSDPLLGTLWLLASWMGRRDEMLRLDLRRPDAVMTIDDPEIWTAYWSGFDRAELSYRTRRQLDCEGPRQPSLLFGGLAGGALAACSEAAAKLIAGRELGADDLVALMSLLHELHHASSAAELGGHDYALACRHAGAAEEGFAHAMSAARLPLVISEVGGLVPLEVHEAWMCSVRTHALEPAAQVVRWAAGEEGLEEAWRRFRHSSLIERLGFLTDAPAWRGEREIRENLDAAAA